MPGMRAEALAKMEMGMGAMERRDATEKVCIDVRAILEQLGLDSQKWHEKDNASKVEPLKP